MKKTLLKTSTILALCLPMLASCSGGLSSGDFEIQFTESIPVAYVNQTYDFSNVIIKEGGINYSLTANYYDFTSKSMKSLAVNGLTFVPVIKSDITVTVTANNATYIKNRKANLRVTAQGDAMDTLLSTGASNFADDGITKDLNLDEKYIKQGNSSIHAKYYGNNYYKFGAAVIAPNNFRCLEQWTDKEWNNAILTFWVYNPTNYDFEFQLRIKENSTAEGGNVDIDWGDPKNTAQFAKPNQWTQIFFSMNKIGVNRPLYVDESLTHNDAFIIKTRWLGTPGSAEAPESYSWQMYIDGVDVVDHTVYPDVDTEPFETLDKGWENMALDTGWGVAKATISKNACHKAGYDKSTTGLELSFDNTTAKGDIGYALAISPEDEVKKGTIEELPDFGKGSIKADLKFSSDITDQTINFFAVKEGWPEGGVRKVNTITLTDLGDGWKRLEFGLDKVSVLKDIGNTVRFGFTFNGINETNKATAKICVDNIFYDEEGDKPAPVYVRGEKFAPNKDASVRFTTAVTVASEDVINVDIKTTTTGKVSIALMDDWGTIGQGYFGYYVFETGEETYTGVTKTVLEDGYTRYAFKVKELDKPAETEGAPKKIDHIYVRGENTTATGYVDASVVK